MLLATFGTGQVLWSIIWFALFFIWIWLLIAVFADIFRSPDLGGWGKALWSLFVIALPYLGVFVYLIARGQQMSEREQEVIRRREALQLEYLRSVVGGPPGPAGQIEQAVELRDRGVITESEFETLKAKALW